MKFSEKWIDEVEIFFGNKDLSQLFLKKDLGPQNLKCYEQTSANQLFEHMFKSKLDFDFANFQNN